MSANDPAFPLPEIRHPASGEITQWAMPGLTKRELTCILCRVPATGDAELDAVIARAERRDVATRAMQGLCALNADYSCRFVDGTTQTHIQGLAESAVEHADTLLAELAKAPEGGAP